jgi:O-antigen/teichoic acid export membrane protein
MTDTTSAADRVHLIRSGLVNYLGTFIPGLIGLAVVAVMLRSLGASAYGIWIAALSLRTLIGAIDLGLSWGVRRWVAEDSRYLSSAGEDFLERAASTYLAVALCQAIAVWIAGYALTGSLHLSQQHESDARVVFALAAVTVIGDQIFAFVYSACQGVQRFGLASSLVIAKAVLQGSGTIVLLVLDHGLIAVAIWHAALAFGIGAVAIGLVRPLAPEVLFRLRLPSFKPLLSQRGFPLASQLTQTAFSLLYWAPALILGALRGSAAIVPYHVGQRFPLAIATLSDRWAEVGFPAASRHASTRSVAALRETLDLVVRWPLVVSFPLSCVAWAVAPELLSAWLGSVPPHAVLVLRLSIIGIVADAPAVGAMHVLWGTGAVRAVLPIAAGMATVSTVLTVVLAPHFGVTGAAAAFLPATLLGSFFLLRAAARAVEMPLSTLLRTATRGLPIPFAAVTIVSFTLVRLPFPADWLEVVCVGAAAGVAYVTALYRFGARAEEREFIGAPLPGLMPALPRPRRASPE